MVLSEKFLPNGTIVGSTVRYPNGSSDSIPPLTQNDGEPASIALEIQSSDTAFVFSRQTTTEIDEMNPTHGMVTYNTTEGHLVLYDDTNTWVPIGGNSGSVVVEVVTAGPVLMNANYRYIVEAVGTVDMNLPEADLDVGDVIEIIGSGPGLWRVTQDGLESKIIRLGINTSTLGTGGRLDSTARGDCVRLVYCDSNAWIVSQAPQGNLNLI
jgi:hypothetical protein